MHHSLKDVARLQTQNLVVQYTGAMEIIYGQLAIVRVIIIIIVIIIQCICSALITC